MTQAPSPRPRPVPVAAAPVSSVDAATEAVATIVPYRNVPALLAYYLGVFALVPIFGVPLAFISIAMGVWGFRLARQNPQSKGHVHAIVGIALGSLTLLAHLAVGILIYAYL